MYLYNQGLQCLTKYHKYQIQIIFQLISLPPSFVVTLICWLKLPLRYFTTVLSFADNSIGLTLNLCVVPPRRFVNSCQFFDVMFVKQLRVWHESLTVHDSISYLSGVFNLKGFSITFHVTLIDELLGIPLSCRVTLGTKRQKDRKKINYAITKNVQALLWGFSSCCGKDWW